MAGFVSLPFVVRQDSGKLNGNDKEAELEALRGAEGQTAPLRQRFRTTVRMRPSMKTAQKMVTQSGGPEPPVSFRLLIRGYSTSGGRV